MTRWLCKCECGNEKIALTKKLQIGKALSCGCKTKEWVAGFGGQFVDKAMLTVRKHGHVSGGKPTSEYASWASMKQRCTNPDDKAFFRYGGRGITVCDRWMEDFQNFLDDMGPKPTPVHTIDRLRYDGNYEPNNCRWATKSEQGQEHKSILIPLQFNGVIYPSVSAACRAAGVNMQSVRRRLWRGVAVSKVFDGLQRK